MTERNIRYELAEELTTKFFGVLKRGEAFACADFILADRRRILEEVLNDINKNIGAEHNPGVNHCRELILAKLAELKELA
jgi:hypothetical protein